MAYQPTPPPPVRRRSNGYVGRRLVFIIVWLTMMMFPSGDPVDVTQFTPGALAIIAILSLAIIYVLPIVAAVQIYKAYKARR